MDFVTILNEYGVLAVIVGIAACILTGAIKMPIKIDFRKKSEAKKTELMTEYVSADEARKEEIVAELNASEIKANNTFRIICNAIAAGLSVIGVLIFYIVTVRSWDMFLSGALYQDMMSAFVVANLAYVAYEKLGAKKLVLLAIQAIKAKNPNSEVLAIVEKILQEDIQIPLTDEQKELFAEKLKEYEKH